MQKNETLHATSSRQNTKIYALVTCAGVGNRAATTSPKQYQNLAGQTVIQHTLAAFEQVKGLSATLVVIAPTDDYFEHCVPNFVGPKNWVARVGGNTRASSVLNGLNELASRGVQNHEWVMVHDAARCLIQPAWIEQLIAACKDDEVGGLLALPLADTLKDAHCLPTGEARSTRTINRSHKWAAQTPQMFRLGLLQTALKHAFNQPDTITLTDEASAVEVLGHQPLLVRGHQENIKITWPDDFALAERLIQTR